MKKWSLALALAVVLAAPAMAGQRTPDRTSRGSRPAPADHPAQPDATAGSNATAGSGTAPGAAAPTAPDRGAGTISATTIRVRGTISTYDADSAVLTLSTTTGVVRFPVASQTRIRHDGRTVDRTELKTLTGLRAAVRYSETGGHTTVESVNVFDTSERNPR
jgi:hypothetical protein